MPVNTPTKKKRSKAKTIVTAALTATGIALIGGYAFVGGYYTKHFFPHTTLGDADVSNKTAAEVEAKNISNADDYLLTVTDRKGNKFHLAGMDFGYEYDAIGEEAVMLDQQNAFAWPVEIFGTHSYELHKSFHYDSDLLTERINQLDLFDPDYIESPTDAYLDISEDSYGIVPETLGNEPIPEQVTAEITAAIDDQQTSLTLSDDCYAAPSVRETDEKLTKTIAKIDAYTNSTIHYEIEGADENLSSQKILSMLDITKKGKVTVNEDKVTQFVQHLASTYNTYGDVRDFKTSKGDIVKIGGGDYGWVISKTREKEQILADLAGGEPVSREPVYEQRAEKSGLDDIGNTYVEIDYTNQHLWYYKKGKLILDSDVVTGNISRGNGSPDGIFKIVYCQRNATLVGENYSTPVKYFMPFCYNVGIHDASWRSQFGGEIYKTNGSHGCVNAPEDVAKKLIDEMELNTPVVAYYREPVTLTAENARISNAYSYVSPNH